MIQSKCSIDVAKYFFCLGILLLQSGGGGVEILRFKLTSAKVEVEVEAELGNQDYWDMALILIIVKY